MNKGYSLTTLYFDEYIDDPAGYGMRRRNPRPKFKKYQYSRNEEGKLDGLCLEYYKNDDINQGDQVYLREFYNNGKLMTSDRFWRSMYRGEYVVMNEDGTPKNNPNGGVQTKPIPKKPQKKMNLPGTYKHFHDKVLE